MIGLFSSSSTICSANSPPVSLRLGHRTALTLSTSFTTVLPLRYPILGKALKIVNVLGSKGTL